MLTNNKLKAKIYYKLLIFRQEFFNKYSCELKTQLINNQSNAPIFLLVSVLILIFNFYKLAIHASGKFVAPLISFLKKKQENIDCLPDKIPSEIFESILETQKLVVSSIKKKIHSTETLNEEILHENIKKIFLYLSK